MGGVSDVVPHLCGLESSVYGAGPFDGRVEYFPLTYLFCLCLLSMPFSLVYSPYLLGERFMFFGFG